ncbi:MAG: metallophosphoesterase [Thermoleophilia bacterium]
MRASKTQRLYISMFLAPLLVILLFSLMVSSAFALQTSNIAVSKVGADSAVLVVKADVTADVTVEYGGYPPSFSFSKTSLGATRHEILLDGLSPGSSVCYRVTITDSADLGTSITVPDKWFDTASPLGTGFSFGVVGDNRPASDTTVQPAAFTSIINQMIGDNLALSLNVGDIIFGTGTDSLAQNVAKYDGLFAATTPLTYSVPMYVAPGNHERLNYTNSKAGYEQEFTFPVNTRGDTATYGEHYYSFDNGDTHFIALSTEIPGQEGLITGNQKAWLISDLAANSRPWVVVFMHRPLFSGAHAGDPWTNVGNATGQANKAEIHALFLANGVDVVFEGHEHFYLHHLEDGIHYIITGGGGAPLSGAPALQAGDILAYSGYEHMKVDEGDTALKVSAIDSSGAVIETFTLGAPQLSLANGWTYWASYADYRSRFLTVEYTIGNIGDGDANNIQVSSLYASYGVVAVTATPLLLGNLAAGDSLTTQVRYEIPHGVTSFFAFARGTCEDDVGDSYSYPTGALL